MTDRMQVLTSNEIQLIHEASMEILTDTGLRFNAEEALEIFRGRGFKIEGSRVFITENDIMKALQTAPSRFTVHARNPVYDVAIGGGDFVFLPTGGAPNVASVSGERRPATLQDYHDCCKLVQTSDQLDMNGLLMVQPTDIPAQTAHLEMLFANMVMCDKAYGGAGMSRQSAVDCLEMAAIAWGGEDELMRQPVMATNVNAASPLKYSAEEAQSIICMARLRQALLITTLVMSGSSGPISLPGTLALANAEILAGVVLAQLAGPGTPVVYGSVSAPADMRTIVSAVGAPEAVALASAAIQMAHFYHLPCRTGGMLTNAQCPDVQAAAEGTLMMSTAVRNGAHLILHACGQLGSYLSMSFEKWLIDEEVCRMLRRLLCAMEINVESIDVATIKSVGSDGNYLIHPTTFKHCRRMYQPVLFTRSDYQKWLLGGAMSAEELAAAMLPQRLAGYVKPPIDQGLEQALREFVDRRKKELTTF
jgi:trimethylamine--corrinoid protein Co-methyltransferase